ncbi:MAG: 3D domain-containing protein [Bacteroidota bacterium]
MRNPLIDMRIVPKTAIGILLVIIFTTSNTFSQEQPQQLDSLITNELNSIDLNKSDTLSPWATYYYIPFVAHNESGIPLLDGNQNPTGLKLKPEDWCKAAIEGTVSIKKDQDNYLLNYAGRSEELQYDCRKCSRYKNYAGYEKTGKVLWGKTTGFGKGVRNFNLVPYRSIAVDPSLLPYGSILYIPAAKGLKYTGTNGEVKNHDGLFLAADNGSQIIGNHIDIFIGTSQNSEWSFIKSKPSATFKTYLISNDKISSWLLKMHQ